MAYAGSQGAEASLWWLDIETANRWLQVNVGGHGSRRPAWRLTWSAHAPGTYELCCRARDPPGHEKPAEQLWTA